MSSNTERQNNTFQTLAFADDDGQKVKSAPSARRSQQADTPSELLFERPEASLYCSLATLPQRAGVPASLLPKLVVKELTDNALDAADRAGRPGAVEVSTDPAGNLIVADKGTGIPDATPEKLARIFSVARPMLSSKLLRRGQRGCVGNGLRVALGYMTATHGGLAIESAGLRVELVPEIDGTSRIVRTETIAPVDGLALTAIAGTEKFKVEHLAWAEDAIELARQSGVPSFTGRPSAHWFDLDHFRVLLGAAVGNVSVRRFLAELDGCSGSRVQSQIAARFLRRPAADLSAEEAAELLAAAQAATRAPKAKALRPLGRDAIITAGYAIAEGSFVEGEHAPRATVPFLVECWADAFEPDEQPGSLHLFMNRTPAVAPFEARAWHGRLDLLIGGAAISIMPVPAGPSYAIAIAITAPMFRITSDGKQPDCRAFRDALREAVGKAAKQAGRDIAAQISSERKRAAVAQGRLQREQEQEQAAERRLSDREARQQRLAWIAAEKAERKTLPTVKDVVLELLPGAVEIEASAGLLFNTRRLLYRIRDAVLRRTGKELEQNYFDRLLTQIEAEQGDLHPQLIREARGNFCVPHFLGGQTIPLGTLDVRKFRRPAWTFNKIITIEKEDLRLMLQQAGWAERHDAMLASSKGFNTRAARDLIDKIAETTEPVNVFAVHDADAAGTLIMHSLQHATLARGERKVEVVDLGLQPWEGVALDLPVERVPRSFTKKGRPMRRPVGGYVRERTDRAPDGETTWEQWLQHSRIELNAFTSRQLIDWLDRKMAEHGEGKLIPPDDILTDQFGERLRDRAQQVVAEAIIHRRDAAISEIQAQQAEATAPINRQIAEIEAPFREQMRRATAELHNQLAQTYEPFELRIANEQAAAAAVNREEETHRTIQRLTPKPEELRSSVDKALSKSPEQLWETALHKLADDTKVEAGEGGAR